MPFGFFDYNKAGKGVAKNEPEKKAFFRFFDLFSRKFWKLFQLNLIYMLFCLPVVTIGPATAALTHVMRKFILEKPIFIYSEFFTAFKKNFKQSVILGIVDVALAALVIYSLIFYSTALSANSSLQDNVLFAITLATALFVIMMHFYIYPQIIALDLKMMAIIKNALLLTVLGLKRTLLSLVLTLILGGLMVLLYPYSLVALPFLPAAWIAIINTFICYPVIQKHIINPFYESKGERNPELPEISTEEALFEDFGGREEIIPGKGKVKTNTKGKLIR